MGRNRADSWRYISITHDGQLIKTFALFMNATIIVDFIRKSMIVGWLPTGIPLNAVRNVIYFICLFNVLREFTLKKRMLMLIFAIVISAFLIAISVFLTPAIATLLPEVVLMAISRFLPAAFLFFYYGDWEARIKGLSEMRLCQYLYFLLAVVNYSRLSEGYMEISYNLLCPTLIIFFYSIKKKNWLPAVGMGTILVFLLIFGARGVILCIFAALAVNATFSLSKQSTKNRVIWILLFLTFLVLMAVQINPVLEMIAERFPLARSLQRIISGGFFSDRSAAQRLRLYNSCWDAVVQEPFAVRGILSDRVILSGIYSESASVSSGYYVHNFLLEIVYQFGVLLGGAVVCWYLISIITSYKNIKKLDDPYVKIIFSSCVAAVFPYMMVSGSYLSEAAHWFLLSTIALWGSKRGKIIANSVEN